MDKIISRLRSYPPYHANWLVLREQAKVWYITVIYLFPKIFFQTLDYLLGGSSHVFLRRKVSVLNYTAATFIFTIWVTDWKVVCKHIPFYGSKYAAGSPKKYSHY